MAKMDTQPEPTKKEEEKKPKRYVKVEDVRFDTFEEADARRKTVLPQTTERLRIRRRWDGSYSLVLKRLEGTK